MVKQKKSPMNTSGGMCVAMGVVIGVLMAIVYVSMTSSKENLDSSPFQKYLTPGPSSKAIKELPSDWVTHRDNCKKAKHYWQNYNERIQKKLSERNATGMSGNCWDINKDGQITNICCDFRI